MYPHSTRDISGILARDVELAKAAVLYADHVDLVSAQAGVLEHLAALQGTGLAAMTSLITDLDDATLAHLGMDISELTPEARQILPSVMTAMDNPQLRSVLPARAEEIYRSLQAPLQQFQATLLQLDSESGARELRRAIDTRLLWIARLQGVAARCTTSIGSAARDE